MRDLISVAIMVRDSGSILDEFLRRLKAQETPIPYELVALYYGVGDETYKKLQAFTKNIKRIHPDEFDIGKCRDLVCSLAHGNYIIAPSIDALPASKHWLKELVEPLRSGVADVVQGDIACPKKGDTNYPDFFYWERNFMFYFTSEGNNFIKKYGNIGFSCINLAFRKNVWKNGGFGGVSYCEDKIFQKRAIMANFTCTYSKKALVIHAHSYKTVNALVKRISNEGVGWKQVGENYGVGLLVKDLLRIDLHMHATRAFFRGDLKYNSEFFFITLRPVALFWGNHFAKRIY